MTPKYTRPDCMHCEFQAHIADVDVYTCSRLKDAVVLVDYYGSQPEKQRFQLVDIPKYHEILVLFDLLGVGK